MTAGLLQSLPLATTRTIKNTYATPTRQTTINHTCQGQRFTLQL